MSDTFERRITFTPAFDRRDPNPNKDYGVGAMTLRFVLIGPKGATQFLMSTGWYLPHVQQGLVEKEIQWMQEHGYPLMLAPNGWDLGYHSSIPQYEGQESRECDLLPGGACYYDGSGLNAEPVLAQFLAGGEAAVWDELERYYVNLFTDAPELAEASSD